MVQKITEKDIPPKVYKKYFAFSWPQGSVADMFFEVSGDQSQVLQGYDDVSAYLEAVSRSDRKPRGIVKVQTLDNDRYFKITYVKETIDDASAYEFAASLWI